MSVSFRLSRLVMAPKVCPALAANLCLTVLLKIFDFKHATAKLFVRYATNLHSSCIKDAY
jgi:hypothetical protein